MVFRRRVLCTRRSAVRSIRSHAEQSGISTCASHATRLFTRCLQHATAGPVAHRIPRSLPSCATTCPVGGLIARGRQCLRMQPQYEDGACLDDRGGPANSATCSCGAQWPPVVSRGSCAVDTWGRSCHNIAPLPVHHALATDSIRSPRVLGLVQIGLQCFPHSGFGARSRSHAGVGAGIGDWSR